jgi:hypothetical protein
MVLFILPSLCYLLHSVTTATEVRHEKRHELKAELKRTGTYQMKVILGSFTL